MTDPSVTAPQTSTASATPVRDAIERNLRREFAPDRLTVIDESHRHAGHAGARPGGESHFRVEMIAASFAGMSRVERQRRVHRALAKELADGVHALALHLSAPGEDAAR